MLYKVKIAYLCLLCVGLNPLFTDAGAAAAGLKGLAKSAKKVDGGPPIPTGCFVAGTLITMADGSQKPIEEVKEGERVLAKDEKSGQVKAKKVTQSFKRTVQESIVITFATGEQIETTLDHPFYSKRGDFSGFLAAGQLGIGTSIVTRAGPRVGIAKVEKRSTPVVVYNMEVEGFHTYFVGKSKLWVHNPGCTPNSISSRIKDDPRLVKEAETAGRSHQRSIDALTDQLSKGNTNPGIGSKHLFGDVHEARSRDGARVYFRNSEDGIEIIGKSNKSNQDRVISILKERNGG